jgi:hypothetical protein
MKVWFSVQENGAPDLTKSAIHTSGRICAPLQQNSWPDPR